MHAKQLQSKLHRAVDKRVSHAKGKNDIILWSYASMQCHISVGTSSTRKQELRDYIDPFESLGMKLTSTAKFGDRNAYFAFWKHYRHTPSVHIVHLCLCVHTWSVYGSYVCLYTSDVSVLNGRRMLLFIDNTRQLIPYYMHFFHPFNHVWQQKGIFILR
jgi:hypothetical protein